MKTFQLIIKAGILLLLCLAFFSCSNSQQEQKTNDRLELIPEPDKDLREVYEKQMQENLKKQAFARSSTDFKESKGIEDEITNEYLKEELKDIRQNFKRINSIYKWDSTFRIDLSESTKNGTAIFYFSDKQLEKIILRLANEYNHKLIEYYLMDNILSFVYDKSIEYDSTLPYDSTTIKENNGKLVFDINQLELIEERSYFKNKQLIHQLSNIDCGSPPSKEYLKEEENRILLEFSRIMKLSKQTTQIK